MEVMELIGCFPQGGAGHTPLPSSLQEQAHQGGPQPQQQQPALFGILGHWWPRISKLYAEEAELVQLWKWCFKEIDVNLESAILLKIGIIDWYLQYYGTSNQTLFFPPTITGWKNS